MTEDQAKKLWCPHRSVASGTLLALAVKVGATQQLASDPTGPNCIGSACAMWRTEAHPKVGDDGELVKRKDVAGVFEWERGLHGHCGLAGGPV